MALVVINDEAPDHLDISLFGANAIMLEAQAVADLIKKGWLCCGLLSYEAAPEMRLRLRREDRL
jgi:hypothetical protein